MMILKKIDVSGAKGWLNKFYNPQLLLTASYLAVCIALMWNPMDEYVQTFNDLNPDVTVLGSEAATNFTRQIGQATLVGIDVYKRISNMAFFGFVYIPLLVLGCWSVLCALFYGHNIKDQTFSFLTRFITAALPAQILSLFQKLTSPLYSILSPIPIVSILAILVYKRFFSHKFSLSKFKWSLFTSILLLFVCVQIVVKYLPEGLPNINYIYIDITIIIYAVLLLLTCVATAYFTKKTNCDSICAAFTPIYAAPVLTSIFLETCNILNQHGIFVLHKILYAVSIYLVCGIIGYIWYRQRGIKLNLQPADYIKYQYPLLALSIACMLLQPSMQIYANTELFEMSNHGSDVYEFLRRGEIPFIENNNVHMIIGELGNILFGVLNGNALDAVYFGYPILSILGYLIYYYLFCTLTDCEEAVLLTLLYPLHLIFLTTGVGSSFNIAFFVILLLLYAVKKKTIPSFLLLSMGIILLLLSSADIGLSVGSAVLTVLTIYLIWKRNIKQLLILWLSCILTMGVCFAIFAIICGVHSISPIERIMEFVSLMSAKTIWAYEKITPSFDLKYYLCYLVVPVLSIFSFIIMIINRKRIELRYLIIISTFFLSYIYNYSRGIIRHNMIDSPLFIPYLLGFSVLAIVLLLWVWKGHKAFLLPCFLCCTVIAPVLIGINLNDGNSLISAGISRQYDWLLYKAYVEKINRVILPPELTNKSGKLKQIFDELLTPEETYYDYTSDTLLYALTNRNKPVFTNQSPSQLNREFDQLLFIEELKSANAPIAISVSGGYGFDGVDFDVNHYLAAEYLYENYSPLCIAAGYIIWAKSQKLPVYVEKIKALADGGVSGVMLIEKDDANLIKSYNLGLVPYLWGTYDTAVSQQVLSVLKQIAPNDLVKMKMTVIPNGDGMSYTFALPTKIVGGADKKLSVAVWSEANGQDDIIWYPVQYNNGLYTAIFNINDHNGEYGSYLFDVYSINKNDESSFLAGEAIEVNDDTNNAKKYYYSLDPSTFDRTTGNYLEFIIESETDTKLIVDLLNSEGGSVCRYTFDIKAGKHNYLIRASSNYTWHTDLIKYMSVEGERPIDIISINILRGDINYEGMNFIERKILENKPALVNV